MAFSRLLEAGPTPPGFIFDFDVAFQAIFDVKNESVWGYEALMRGPNGESAQDVLAQIPPAAIYAADQHCRETAIMMAAQLGMKERLSLNFLRGALLAPQDYVAATMACADRHGFPTNRIILEFSEAEPVPDPQDCRRSVNKHLSRGFQTAMDDFGAGHQGLSLLCEVHPDIIKLDMSLIRNIDTDPRRAKVVAMIIKLCRSLDVIPIVEGVETEGELDCLTDIGIHHFQGFLFALPKIAGLLTLGQVEKAMPRGRDSLEATG